MDDQHDSLCRQQYWTGSDCFDCRLIALVRADERRQWTMMLKERTEERDEARHDAQAARAGHRVTVMAYLDAESVAARLVEVICRQEQQIDDLVEHVGDFASDVLVLTGERDAARAKVEAMRGRYWDIVAGIRMHKADERRDVLADLQDKVEGLRERGDAHADDCPGRPGMRGICACDGNILVSRTDVLALIEEAQP